MPKSELIAEFKRAFEKLHTDVTNEELPDMNQTSDASNNAKLRAVVVSLLGKLNKHIYKSHVATEIAAIGGDSSGLIKGADDETKKDLLVGSFGILVGIDYSI